MMKKKGYVTIEEFERELATIPGMSQLIVEERANLCAAEFIRHSREVADLSQAELAEEIGITQARVSQLERAESPEGPSIAMLARVAKACGRNLRLTLE
jgi:ribosome-binding protein aMBF1 (putative translation factor)